MTEFDAMERFTAIYQKTSPRVYAYAVSRAGRQLAEEIVSEVYMVAWRKLADLPAPELPWLLAVARRVAASHFRDSVRQESIAAELRSWIAEADRSADDIADQVTERAVVLAALASLSEADRELLTLVAWHGLPAGDAAAVVGCSTATYFVRLHRARRRLEQAIRDPAVDEHARSGGPAAAGGPAVAPASGQGVIR